jgi:hypothetical protein
MPIPMLPDLAARARGSIRLAAALAASLPSVAVAETLLSLDFESDAVGGRASGLIYYPEQNEIDLYASVVAHGLGQGLKLYDDNNGADRLTAQASFAAGPSGERQVLAVSFVAARGSEFLGVDDNNVAMIFGLGSSGADVSLSAHRPVELRLRQDGRVVVYDGSATRLAADPVVGIDAGASFMVVVNLHPLPLSYLGADGTTRTLSSRRWSLWLNQTLVELGGRAEYALRGGAVDWTSGGLGRVGFTMGNSGAVAGLSYRLDSLSVTGLVEPQPPPGPNTPPTIGAIAQQTAANGRPAFVQLLVDDAETPTAIFLTTESSNQAVVPNSGLSVVGYGQEQSLRMVPVGLGSATITVTATDYSGLTAQRSFTVESLDKLFFDDFAGLLPEGRPEGYETITPVENLENLYAKAAPLGASQGLKLYDNNGDTRAGIEVNFVNQPEDQVEVFEFGFKARVNADDFPGGTDVNTSLIVSAGSYDADATGTTTRANLDVFRAIHLRLRQDGRAVVYETVPAGTGTSYSSVNPIPGITTGVVLKIVANNSPAAIAYVGPDGSTRILMSGKWSIWADQKLLELAPSNGPMRTQFGFRTSTATNFTGKFGRVGVTTGSGNINVGISYTIDDFQVDVPQFSDTDVLFSEDFEERVLGARPTDFATVTPATNTGTLSASIVPFAGGKGLRLFDYDPARAGVEANFVPNDAAGLQRLQFGITIKVNSEDFVSDPLAEGAQAKNVIVGIGSYNTAINTSTRGNTSVFRAVDFRVLQDGRLLLNEEIQHLTAEPFPGIATGVAFVVVANSSAANLDYTGPDGSAQSLAPGRWSLWADGQIVSFALEDETVRNQFALRSAATDFTGRFGRFAATTGNANGDEGMSFTIDDLSLRKTVSFPTSGDALAAWRQFYFGTSASEGSAADFADPDGDGMVNLVEFALGGNPLSPGPLWSVSRDGDYLALAYTLDLDAKALVEVTPQWAASLDGEWGSVGVQDLLISSAGGIELREARVQVDGARKFLRLRVGLKP